MVFIFNRPKMGEDTIKIAETCEQEGGYSILFGNCETFANMCRYGHPISFQVNIHSEKFNESISEMFAMHRKLILRYHRSYKTPGCAVKLKSAIG